MLCYAMLCYAMLYYATTFDTVRRRDFGTDREVKDHDDVELLLEAS